jgi:AbrB family looped-hinge helix DNA binding protein
MDAIAKLTSKGQITVPKAVRDALGLAEGDAVHFRVDGERVTLARIPDFLSLAGTFTVPADKRNATWDEIVRSTHTARARRRR